MALYDITVRVETDTLHDAKFLAECITDPGAQVADLANQMGARLLGAHVTNA